MDKNIFLNGFETLRAKLDLSATCLKQHEKLLSEEWTDEVQKQTLGVVAQALLQPELTIPVADGFSQLLLPLFLESSSRASQHSKHHQLTSIALAKLIDRPGVFKYALSYYKEKPAPWIIVESDTKKPKTKKQKTEDEFTDLDLLEACYKFLQFAGSHFRQCWDWSKLIEMSYNHKDFYVRWLSCQCAAAVSCMSEEDKFKLVKKHLKNSEILESKLRYCNFLNTPIEEETNKSTTEEDEDDSERATVAVQNLTELAVSVMGVTLPVFDSTLQKNEGIGLVHVDSTLAILKNVALAVASGKPICLSGPVGCGKTALIDHLAAITGRTKVPHLLKVQLGEETDAKLLLGGYKCSDLPGEFIWQSGALTQAVTEGHWLVLEDIDTASSDVAAVLLSLLETGSLSVPGFKDGLSISPGFQIFFTYRTLKTQSGDHRQHTPSIDLLNKLWVPVAVDALSEPELVQIVQSRFAALSTIATRMVAVFTMFTAGNQDGGEEEVYELVRRSSGRLTSVRDLLKWCVRAEAGFDVTSQESALKVLQDGIDIFCCSIADTEKRIHVAGLIAAKLGIIKTNAEHFLTTYKATIDFNASTCTAGRGTIQVKQSTEAVQLHSWQSRFALTRPSCCLLERLAVCLSRGEPILLVGETGTGKTSTLQLLARQAGTKLVVLNMNQQSDSADLLGGYKPVDMKHIMAPIRDQFETNFRAFFNVEQNIKFLEHISTCFNAGRWPTLLRLMKHSQSAAVGRLQAGEGGGAKSALLADWLKMGDTLYRLEQQLKQGHAALAFSFIEGALVKALKSGYWVLLDEINLAAAETLQCLCSLLEGERGSVTLLEQGQLTQVPRHPEFRLMAAMNPATDVGKKELAAGIRNRFTELFVDEVVDRTDLCLLVKVYLPDLSPPRVDSIVRFYLQARQEAIRVLADTSGHKPHYSLRTLCRALMVAAKDQCGSVQRSLYEALCLSFLTQLDSSSHKYLQSMIAEAVVGKEDIKSLLNQKIPEPTPVNTHINFVGYWVAKGPSEPNISSKYIVTASVKRNLHDVVRVVSLSSDPVLIQGDTSVGKTSLVTYLADASGNTCTRINNHEHTDLQEYIGAYAPDPVSGKLVFKEGVLVEAMRKGHWIILDELNLAPTDVLEALNRVLDDNRELYIPETQQLVKADPRFRLFATQNPPGLYGGRKMLSRAFRNRFVELHFDEIPPLELEVILQKRCEMPSSYCKKLVAVMTDLQMRRRGSAAFAGKQGFITLRDLFRWGERYRLATQNATEKFYDWDQHLADEGFLVLAGRVRKEEERQTIIDVINKHLKRKVDMQKLFTLNENTSFVTKHILEAFVNAELPEGFKHIVWTYNLRRIAVVLGKAFEFNEPALLVGETGCGKTTVIQVLAAVRDQQLKMINCHQNSESADFLGGLRPVRDHSSNDGKLFEWVDGPLVEAMRGGHAFLADELSLADDSVLERMNSLLEPERKLLLTEKGSGEQEVVADVKFQFAGTMNPGGDFGKKELSPALRNRLTEIWCDTVSSAEDTVSIIEHNIRHGVALGNQQDASSGIGRSMVEFIDWFKSTEIGKRFSFSIRDILTWVNFINTSVNWGTDKKVGGCDPVKNVASAYVFGACVVCVDGLGTSVESREVVLAFQKRCLQFLVGQMEKNTGLDLKELGDVNYTPSMVINKDFFVMGPVSIPRGENRLKEDPKYLMYADTVKRNLWRVLRGLQLPERAVLLEGSPGVGKTSLITNLARLTGNNLTRINLSEQTDVSDLFGADLPVEGAAGGVFEWRDGPFLRALKSGHWILLDELNLASQAILESLNAVLDHRGELFVPELGKTFQVKTRQTKLFACQNPQRQGGARKGLPKSFLNRFTKVYVEPFTADDLAFIVRCVHRLPAALVARMVQFSCQLERLSADGQFKGGPWEMNLRDLVRWAEASSADVAGLLGRYARLIYVDRMRSEADRSKVMELYTSILGEDYPLPSHEAGFYTTRSAALLKGVGVAKAEVTDCVDRSSQLLVLNSQLATLQSLAACVNHHWMAIVVGGKGSGKTSVVHVFSQLCGRRLSVLGVNSATDTSDILGGFEQADLDRRLDCVAVAIEKLLKRKVQELLLSEVAESQTKACRLLGLWARYVNQGKTTADNTGHHQTLADASQEFAQRVAALLKVVACVNAPHEMSAATRKELALLSACTRKGEGDSSSQPSSGGTFEWVDSLLVKCLREGRWLLVDNANLCSPAVLDRLNGLLEPSGELVLGERGASANGSLYTVKPHPNFRLFITVDPKYGEISRAMRNRGVEIFMTTNRPGILGNQHFEEMDVYALLAKCGLRLRKLQDLLIKIHQTVVANTYGSDDFTVSQLLNAATLIVQLHSYGVALRKSFRLACNDVYLKNLNVDPIRKEKISTAIEELFTYFPSPPKLEIRDLYFQTLSTYDVQNDCDSSMAARNLAFVTGVLEGLRFLARNEKNPKLLARQVDQLRVKSLVGLNFSSPLLEDKNNLEMKVVELLPNLLLHAFSTSSKTSYDFVGRIIKTLAEKLDCESVDMKSEDVSESFSMQKVVIKSCEKLVAESTDLKGAAGYACRVVTKCVEVMGKLLEDFKFVDSEVVLGGPWDIRRLLLKLKQNGDWSSENKLFALLYFIVRRAAFEGGSGKDEDEDDTGRSLEIGTMSVLDYSEALRKGWLTDMVSNEPLISQFGALLGAVDDCVMLVLNSVSSSLSTEKLFQFLSALEWRFRLEESGKMVLFDSPESTQCLPQVSQKTRMMLTMHYKWLDKTLLPMLVEMIDKDSSLYSSQQANAMVSLLGEIEVSLHHEFTSPLLSLTKPVRAICGQYLPPTNIPTKEGETVYKGGSIYDCSARNLKKSTLVERIGEMQTAKGRRCRLLNIEARAAFFSGDKEEMDRAVQEEQNLSLELKTVVDPESEGKQLMKPRVTPEIKLFPVNELLALRMNTAVRLYFLKNSGGNLCGIPDESMEVDGDNDDNLLSNLHNSLKTWTKWLQSSPVELAALMSLATPISKRQKLFCLLLEQFSCSLAVKRANLWLSWGDASDVEGDHDQYFKDDGELCNPTSPLLSYFVALLTFPDSGKGLEIDSLRGHQHRVELLNALKTTLWRNVATLSSPNLDFAVNEEMCVRNALKNFSQALQKSLIDKGYIKPVNDDESDDLSMETDVDDEDLVLKQVTEGLECLYKQKEEKKVWRKKDVASRSPAESIPSMFKGVKSALDNISTTDNNTDRWILLGSSWTYLGLAQLIVFSCVEAVDPVKKTSLKLGYIKEEKQFLEQTVCVEVVQAASSGATDYVFREEFGDKRRELLGRLEKLGKDCPVRPNVPEQDYNDLVKDFFHLTQNVCSVTRVEGLMRNLLSKTDVENVLKETALWLRNVDTFLSVFGERYDPEYPDIVGPIMSAITQIKYGVRLMMCGVEKCVEDDADEEDEDVLTGNLELLGRFPLTSRAQVLELVSMCSGRKMADLLRRAAEEELKEGGPGGGRNATFRLAKFCLQEMHNIVQIKGDVSDDWSDICAVLDHVVWAWEHQEEERRQRILAEESLYVNKVRMRGEMPTEQEETEEEISAFFNPNREADFGDLEPAPLEGRKPREEEMVAADEKEEAEMIKLTVKDLQEIHRIHSEMVQNNTVTHWRRQLDSLNHQPNFLAPYEERFAVFKLLLSKFCRRCDVSLDYAVGAGLCVAAHIATRAGHIHDDSDQVQELQDSSSKLRHRQYDFYNDAHIGESRQCLSLLRSLMERVHQLMLEWPDHPTLNQIKVLVERIEAFDACSPVARFLTGLELVLTKVREWEENAHSGVSLANHMSAMVRQVIAWRKLELSCWKGCLFATRNRLKGEVSKWWFHLYSLVAAFLKTKSSPDDPEITEKVGECELVKALQSFMEKSTLVEYGPRLELLLTFHCHSSNMIEPGHCQAASIFWNCYCYYKQFETVVEMKIKELGAPVEKKLVDFVKIARWNEITYWSVKETVQKTHRTLHKYIKEYEGVLNESVLGALVKLDFVGDKKIHDTKFEVNPAHYVTVNPVKPNDFGLEVFIMGAEMSILKKACKFSKLTIQNMRYGDLIGVVDDLVAEIVKTTQELSNLEVDRSLVKEKQRSQAKSFLQQKRKALTDLFRVLSDIGLSYRTGLVVCPDEATVLEEQFVVAPLNIEEALKQIDRRDADKDLLAVWNAGGEKHFWHAIARTAQLKKTLRKPHKEIGPPIIERCKGFTNHLMKITVDEKKSLTETVTYLYQMRCYTRLLGSDVHYTDYKHTEVLVHCQHELQNLLNDCVYSLEQFKVLLDACPVPKTSLTEEDTVLSNTMLDHTFLGPMILANKGDTVWTNVLGKVELQISAAKSIVGRIEQANRFEKFSETLKRTDSSDESGANIPSFLTRDKFVVLKDSVPKLVKLVADLNEIRGMFDLKLSMASRNPFVDFLSRLTEKLQTILDKITVHTELDQPSIPTAKEQLNLINKQTLEEFANKTDDCTSSILIAIQELYKKYGKSGEAKKSTETNQEKAKQSTDGDQSDESSLEENHLKSKVVENIGEDVKKLNLAAVTRYIEELLEELAIMEGHDRIACKSLLERCCPLFDQYLLLAQFVVTHQLSAYRVSSKLCSVLSSLFVNLSQKGFCTPEDLADELDEDGGESEAKGGMGLGEGEGQKDVSDQIESEDQLEEARPKGEERDEEEKECKEEEKGIEMSEDFGGKLQDLEKDEEKDGEEEDEEKEGEEPDKEMGETEKGAETVDQEIWGSDSDEEEEEGDDSEKKEEEGDSGEQMGEKEWGAKEDGKEPKSDDKEGGKNDRKDEEKDEINEMEEKEGDDDQVDPYHNKNQQQMDPEEFDLPEDLNLDDGEAKDDEDKEEGGDEEKENPFDIDNMKDMDEGGEEEEEEEKKGGEGKDKEKNIDEEEEGSGGEDDLNLNLDESEEVEEKDTEEGGKKDEKKTGEEEKERSVEEGEEKEEEEAKASEDKAAVEQTERAEEAAGSKDEVAAAQDQAKPDEGGDEKEPGVSEGAEQEGVGHAEQEERSAGHGGVAKQSQRDPIQSQGRDQKRQRQGDSDERHTLADLSEPDKKKVKTIDAKEEEQSKQEEEGVEMGEEEKEADLYQHITDASKSKQDVEVVDAATKEQSEKQKVTGEEKEEPMEEEDEDVICLEDEDDIEMAEDELQATQNERKMDDEEKKKRKKDEEKGRGDLKDMMESKMEEEEGEMVGTERVERGVESFYHTKLENWESVGLSEMRVDLEARMGSWLQSAPPDEEASEVWGKLSGAVTSLAAELSEQLRLVLEPTSAARLKGDFRTGRRINMRKVIPYIASQFRKDKIWLRRTKPSKRDYQVVLAIDDSSSMSDNHSKQLAFESLALVSKALTLLEVGQLCVVSFGEKPRVLHPLSEPFTEHSGAKLMQQLLFEQQKTHVGSLLEFACDMLAASGGAVQGGAGGGPAQLLVIVSDGRGVMDEGEARVKAAVRRARLQNVFTVFVVVDNPSNKDSILDIRMPKFVDGKLLGISSYMDSFPFPFYLILRDINGLPMVLSDALRQWFELVTNLV
ncbi:midasin-like [Nilaparvata lugens]|uniref:midasin-like n=1 Tax=Nilaparvata lugens TaxID=108931 RepID=UPI00193E1E58|nr:midasin-like [Nilaparvata lugens]